MRFRMERAIFFWMTVAIVMTSVLFVCMGNICRSPMAQGLFLARAVDAGLELTEVDSAGTSGYHAGEQPDPRAQAAAKRQGIDISDQRARRVTLEDFTRFDHIVAMDRSNLENLRRLAPGDSRAELSLLLSHGSSMPLDEVPDPYYGEDAGFSRVLELIASGAEGLVRTLSQKK